MIVNNFLVLALITVTAQSKAVVCRLSSMKYWSSMGNFQGFHMLISFIMKLVKVTLIF